MSTQNFVSYGDAETLMSGIKEAIDDAGGGGGASTLGELSDVNITSPANGNILKYSSNLKGWKNGKNPEVSFGMVQLQSIYADVPYDTFANAFSNFWTNLKTHLSYMTTYGNIWLGDGYTEIACDTSNSDYYNKLSKIEGMYHVEFLGNNQCNPSLLNYFYSELLLTPIVNMNVNPRAVPSLISKIYIRNAGTPSPDYYIFGANGQESSDITPSTTGIYFRGGRFNTLQRKPGDA